MDRGSSEDMSIAQSVGQSGRVAVYEVPDDQLATGSTLGGSRVTTVIKASGAIEKVYAVDAGFDLFGTLILRHYDAVTGMYLSQSRIGTFVMHPEHQEHIYTMSHQISVHEDIFVLDSRGPADHGVDPPGVYQVVQLRNDGYEPLEIMTYAYAVLRGKTGHDITVTYDKRLHAFVVWNESQPELARVFGCSEQPESYETTIDLAQAVLEHCPGVLSNTTDAPTDPLGVLQHRHSLDPKQTARITYLLSVGNGRREALANYRACPDPDDALQATKKYYHDALARSVVFTPDPYVNRGVLWAKADMLRVETKAPTGWCFTNDPTRSNNSVGRDTAWFGFGADYLTPDFVREALLAYVRLQEKKGMFIEYYDIRTGKTEDYGLNINDNTPLLIMALWHHFNATGDRDFLAEVYPAAVKAGHYILSQRNEQGLVWCTAHGTADWGIVGWRNVIPNYRLSGATTEVNSECYSAFHTISHMARVMGQHEDGIFFNDRAEELRKAINEHLYNPENGLYYLHIDLDGHPRSDVTADLVFPVMFGVAPDRTAAHIIGRLSNQDFWTSAGIRTIPRDSPDYTPNGGWGLLGGVWVGVSFWYAFAAAKYSPGFMAHALSSSYRNYSANPRQNNTVPGQFSEWLNGETLVNEGMMLSPWFPPRYLWAAIEGMAGFSASDDAISVDPRLAPDWKWMAVQNLPHRGQNLTWCVVRMPDVQVYANFLAAASQMPQATYEADISGYVEAPGDSVATIGLRQGRKYLLFAGNTAGRTITTSISLNCDLSGAFRVRIYDSLFAEWSCVEDLIDVDEIRRGLSVKLEAKGFSILEMEQEV